VIVVNLLPHLHTVQIGCSRVLTLQSYGLGPVQCKDTHTLMTLDPFINLWRILKSVPQTREVSGKEDLPNAVESMNLLTGGIVV